MCTIAEERHFNVWTTNVRNLRDNLALNMENSGVEHGLRAVYDVAKRGAAACAPSACVPARESAALQRIHELLV